MGVSPWCPGAGWCSPMYPGPPLGMSLKLQQVPSWRLPSSAVTPYLLLTVSYQPSIRPTFFRDELGNCLQNLLLSHLQETLRGSHLLYRSLLLHSLLLRHILPGTRHNCADTWRQKILDREGARKVGVAVTLNPTSREGPTACRLPDKSPKMDLRGKERNLLFNGKFLPKISG